jgi:hypothetical protein
MAPMSDTDDDTLAEEFKAACERVTKPDQWTFFPTGDTNFEKGIRRGLELVLLTIRDECEDFDIRRDDDNSYQLSLAIYQNLTYRQNLATVVRNKIDLAKGDDEAICAFSAFLRAQADEVDKAIGYRWKGRRKKEALEEEP